MIISILLVQNWKLREIKKKKNLLSATMENCNSHSWLMGYKMVQTFWNLACQFLTKFSLSLFKSSTPLLGVHPKEIKTYGRKCEYKGAQRKILR